MWILYTVEYLLSVFFFFKVSPTFFFFISLSCPILFEVYSFIIFFFLCKQNPDKFLPFILTINNTWNCCCYRQNTHKIDQYCWNWQIIYICKCRQKFQQYIFCCWLPPVNFTVDKQIHIHFHIGIKSIGKGIVWWNAARRTNITLWQTYSLSCGRG